VFPILRQSAKLAEDSDSAASGPMRCFYLGAILRIETEKHHASEELHSRVTVSNFLPSTKPAPTSKSEVPDSPFADNLTVRPKAVFLTLARSLGLTVTFLRLLIFSPSSTPSPKATAVRSAQKTRGHLIWVNAWIEVTDLSP
jgi:hypothetical protein